MGQVRAPLHRILARHARAGGVQHSQAKGHHNLRSQRSCAFPFLPLPPVLPNGMMALPALLSEHHPPCQRCSAYCVCREGPAIDSVHHVGLIACLQVTLMICMWLGAFSLPWVYLQCRHALDLLVEEAVLFLAAHLSQHSRLMLVAAGLSGVTAAVMVNASVVPRICTAVATTGAVLWWNHMRMRPTVQITEVFDED